LGIKKFLASPLQNVNDDDMETNVHRHGQDMRKLDIRGVIQPFSFLIISRTFKEMREDEILEVIWSEPNSVKELFKILPPASYALVLLEALKEENAGVRFQLKKTGN